MDEYKPPFTITNSILSHVASVSEKVGRITVMSNMENKPHLRKNNRIKSIHSSLKIEANSLSLSQVRDVINGKLVFGEAKEIQEVKNAYNAYEKIAEIDPYSIEELKKFHGIMTKYIVEESGDFRNGEEGVFNGEECIFMAPPARFVPQLMNELFGWMKKEKDQMHPLILSSVFHYEFVFIHPFTDGNGRMARLWHTAILAKWNPIFEYIPIESQIEKFQDDYYDAIAKCHVEGESTVFIEFMLTQIDNTLAELLNQMTDSATDDAILDADGANHGADHMEGRLLSGLKQNPYITQTDLAKELSLSRRTVQRIMKELMNDGKIKRVGSTRTGHWEIND